MDIEHISDYSMFKYTWPDSEQLNVDLKEAILQEEQEAEKSRCTAGTAR